MAITEKHHENQQHLIPGLPDELSINCLIRVPNRFHSNLKSVSRSWRNLVTHPFFYRERQKSGTAEHLVCLVQALTAVDEQPSLPASDVEKKTQLRRRHCPPLYGLTIYNVSYNTWHPMIGNDFITGIPMFCQCVALPSSGKLLLIGGWNPATLESVSDVYVYDFIAGGGWHRAAPMTVARSFFACSAVGSSTVYVAGGHDNQKNALPSSEVYNADADEWKVLPDMTEERDESQGLSCEGDSRFWVVSGYGTESQGRFKSDAECYDPVTGSWSKIEGVWPFPNLSPRATTATQKWLFWGCGGERNVKEFDGRERKWKVTDSIPDSVLIRSSPCVAPIHGSGKGERESHRIFVMGSGDGNRNNAFIWDSTGNRSNSKWKELQTPANFSGFAYSASSILI